MNYKPLNYLMMGISAGTQLAALSLGIGACSPAINEREELRREAIINYSRRYQLSESELREEVSDAKKGLEAYVAILQRTPIDGTEQCGMSIARQNDLSLAFQAKIKKVDKILQSNGKQRIAYFHKVSTQIIDDQLYVLAQDGSVFYAGQNEPIFSRSLAVNAVCFYYPTLDSLLQIKNEKNIPLTGDEGRAFMRWIMEDYERESEERIKRMDSDFERRREQMEKSWNERTQQMDKNWNQRKEQIEQDWQNQVNKNNADWKKHVEQNQQLWNHSKIRAEELWNSDPKNSDRIWIQSETIIHYHKTEERKFEEK